MKIKPTLQKCWQEVPECECIPTCYEPRNPAMPWRPAAESAIDDAEDRADARELVGHVPAPD